ncbi:alpha/beta fold hydrolase [Sphaerisporangium sp. NPDC051011]|uniref:thioesterase II family protein n=1 Tax=Sphaerisporangium sp. NPDC051011 TaxID=3155792 RepID=UPI0033D4CA41
MSVQSSRPGPSSESGQAGRPGAGSASGPIKRTAPLRTGRSSWATWFPAAKSRPFSRLRLFCFPHAGGSAAVYHQWHLGLSPAIEVRAVQYPGRADRMSEPLISDDARMVSLVTEAMGALLDRPVALFGHSMGAVLAYETARALRELGTPPVHLFVSGRRAPQIPLREEPVAHADDETFMRSLRALGGTDADVLDDPQIRELTFPYVRNDFDLIESYVHRDGPPLACPVTVLAGDEDAQVTPEDVERWREVTTGEVTVRFLPGDHFYLVPRQAEVLAEIDRALD